MTGDPACEAYVRSNRHAACHPLAIHQGASSTEMTPRKNGLGRTDMYSQLVCCCCRPYHSMSFQDLRNFDDPHDKRKCGLYGTDEKIDNDTM